MAKAIPIRPRISNSSALEESPIAIIASKFNKEYVDALIEACVHEFKDLLPTVLIHVVRVPGAYEIPVTIKKLAEQNTEFSSYIALGLIVDGETSHGSLVASSVSSGIMNLSLELSTPIINEVLHVHDYDQAQERCMGQELNRGVEAARTAYSMLKVFDNLSA